MFISTDIINEYFGRKGVRFLSFLTVGLISYAFAMTYLGIERVPASWWLTTGTPDMQAAYAIIFGQGMWIIVGSLTAFTLGQTIDAMIYHRVRCYTGERKIWLRATGSTLVSPLLESFVVLYIAFVIGPQQWSMSLFLAIGMINYIYKFLLAITLTSVIYMAHAIIDRFLREALADQLKQDASQH